jgi:uncharacterized protein (TIGR02246 family)
MSDDEREIREVISRWMAAVRDGDVDTVLSLMTGDALFLQPGQPVMDRAGFARAARAQATAGSPRVDSHSSIVELRIAGDWAFMISELTAVMTPAACGAPTRRAGHTLTVFERRDGGWRLARDANLLAPVNE